MFPFFSPLRLEASAWLISFFSRPLPRCYCCCCPFSLADLDFGMGIYGYNITMAVRDIS
jgi:hypothetical protein